MEWWLTLIIVLSVILGICLLLYLLKLYIRRAKYTKATKITNKVVVITGANTGIGKETAIDLAARGGKVYIACRDVTRGEEALKDIKAKSGSDKVYFIQLDLASLESIRQFSKKFHELEHYLHILICNAGIMMCPKMSTEDGFEMQFGVNHLGHFLLTNLLLDLLKQSSPSRVVVVSSEAHKWGTINREDLMSEKNYVKYKVYGQSKLANILFARELRKRLEGTGVTANSCHPGVVNTEGRHSGKFIQQCFIPFFKPFLKTPNEGAQTQIMLALDPDLEQVTGKYFKDCKEKTPTRAARDDGTAEWLWNRSEMLVGF